jgi:hypothetical protein
MFETRAGKNLVARLFLALCDSFDFLIRVKVNLSMGK